MSKLRLLAGAAALSVAAFLTAAPASAGVILFQDDFDRGGVLKTIGCCYSYTDYSDNSIGNGWSEVESSSNDVSIQGDATNQYARLRDNRSSGPPDAGVAQMAGISTVGYNNISLTYDLAPATAEYYSSTRIDYVYVEWKLVTDASWNLVHTHIAPNSNSSTFFTTVDALGAGAANITNLQFRFYTDVTTSSDKWHLDNVILMGDLIPTNNVPEPGTLGLLGLGLLGAGIARRRKTA